MLWRCSLAAVLIASAVFAGDLPAGPSARYKILVTFHGKNGARPSAGFAQGPDGKLYSTTEGIGGHTSTLKGLIYSVTPEGEAATVASLPGFSMARLVLASDGNFYGTTTGEPYGPPTIFRLTPGGVRATLYRFCSQPNCPDGFNAEAPLIQATDGSLYGTTNAYGANGYPGGTVFRITTNGQFSTVYSFCAQPNCADGTFPTAPVIQGTDGNFYGTTLAGGNMASGLCAGQGCGTVFKLTPGGMLTTLYKFCSQPDCADSAGPFGGLVQASDGNLYGTTQGVTGGTGTIFRITTGGTFSTLYSFCSLPNCADGLNPQAGLIQATDGDLYGTTAAGASGSAGTLFRITLAGALTVLHTFCPTGNDCRDAEPIEPLFQATDGNIYGTTYASGPGSGTTAWGTAFRYSTGLPPFVMAIPASGPAGTPVTILGIHLARATRVTFNGRPVSSFSINATGSAISTTVPAGATTGEIRVTTPTRKLKSNTDFRVTTPPMSRPTAL